MKLFTIGPVQMHDFTADAHKGGMPYFRTEEFSAFTFGMDTKYRRIIHTADTSENVYLTASGTAAMEAVVINLFDTASRLLVINGGSFGQRFSHICDIHKIPHDDVVVPFGETLTAAMLDPFENTKYDGLLVNLDESSTGQLYDVHMLGDFCRRKDMFFVVDAITSFLCDDYRMDEFGVDVTIASSQKGLSLSPGLAIVTLNQHAVKRAESMNPETLYFDFKEYFVNMKRGQMPFTPAIGIFLEMDSMLDYILDKGLDKHLAQIADNAAYFRSRIGEFGGRLPGYPLSNAITPVVFDKPVAKQLFDVLKGEGIFINPVGGARADYMTRVAHVGDLHRADYDMLIDKIKAVLENIH